MPRMNDLAQYNQVLTNIARGYSNNELIADALFPVVNVDKETGRIPLFGKEAFRTYKTERAIRAESNVRDAAGVKYKTFQLKEYDHAVHLDKREIAESTVNLMQLETRNNQEILMLGNEKAAADIAQNASLYATGNKTAIVDGNDSWNDPDSQPDIQILDYIASIRAKIAKAPNVLVLGAASFEALRTHAYLQNKLIYQNGGVVTIEKLQELFQIPKIVVGQGVYNNGGANVDIWGETAILAYVAPQTAANAIATLPSFGYRLRLSGYPKVDEDPSLVSGKVHMVRNTDITSIELTGVTNTGTDAVPVWEIESAYLVTNTCA